jgi:AraC family transcriptional activator of pobA
MPKKQIANNIPTFPLDRKYFYIHKKAKIESKFGLDNTDELINSGFGIYSSARVREKIGPIKSAFYRIGFCRKGSLQVECGADTFTHTKDTIHFNFPGQLFVLKNKSKDMFSYYILFTSDFIEEILPGPKIASIYPFLDYGGIPFFKLSREEAGLTQKYFFEIDREIKNNYPEKSTAIKLLTCLILLTAKRSYLRQGLQKIHNSQTATSLLARYKQLVAQHFIEMRRVADYSSMLSVSAKHLSKAIKEETGKSPGFFINEMLMMEIKALLKYSPASISEIAYQLNFTDPSHLSKFFKKNNNNTPQQFRKGTLNP